MYAKRYKNKRGEEKVEVLLSIEEAKRAVELPSDLVSEIKKALDESTGEENSYKPLGAPGNLDGLKILFDDMETRADTETAE